MRGQIVRPFIIMFIVAFTLRHQPIEESLEIPTHRRVGIFVDRQGSRGVLQPEVQQTDAVAPQFRQRRKDFIRDQMEATRPRAQGDQGLLPHPQIPVSARSAGILARPLKKQRAPCGALSAFLPIPPPTVAARGNRKDQRL
ncbi:hypothetical protein D3C81_1617490 [compost metagenome]